MINKTIKPKQVAVSGYSKEELKKKEYKKNAIQAAKDLHYSDKVISKLYNAETDEEVSRIMYDARHGYIK